MKSQILVTSLVTLSLQAFCADSSTSSSAGSSSTTSGSTPQEIRFSKLKDANMVSKSGEDLGKMEDLLINPHTGQIHYIVLGRGGVLGIGEKLVPVP